MVTHEAHILDDRWDEEGGGVSSNECTHIHWGSKPDLPVEGNPLHASAIESIHTCVGDIGPEFAEKEDTLVVRQEFRGLWPVNNPELGNDPDD